MLKTGDRVEIVKYTERKYEREYGEVISVSSEIKRVTQPVNDKLPKPGNEKRYDVKLDMGKELYGLREGELRKVAA
ncbi:MAG: hypothetical protein PHW65_02480 [Dehalococcoidales bacterium]|nr:hypothetical protein [Dehalococcoidales bacterium]